MQLAPLVVERMLAAAAFGALAPATLAIAAAGDGLRLDAFDLGFALVAGIALIWLMRRQLRRRIAAAPEAPPEARLATARTTTWRELRIAVPVAAILALSAPSGRGAEALICVVAAMSMVWNAFDLRRWERRAGMRIYRERRIWARGAPFFRLVPLRTPGGASPRRGPGR
jgi:hypothetical protein